MHLFHYRGKYPNFGDELNQWMWPKILPGFFDNSPRTTFVGTGSTIGEVPEIAERVIVCGAGYVPHYHQQTPNVLNERWDMVFVRGPRTAARLGLPFERALGDSGILVRELVSHRPRTPKGIAFIPHWESMERGNWEEACALAGIRLIDPRLPVIKVMEALQESTLVIAEAMHGAIVADALRVPWLPVLPLNIVHREKWLDWAEAFGISLDPKRLWPSGLEEVSLAGLRQSLADAKQLPLLPEATAESSESFSPSTPGRMARAKRYLKQTTLAPHIERQLVELAALRLDKLSRVTGQLSEESRLNQATERMLEALEGMRKRYARAPEWQRTAMAQAQTG